MRRLSSVCIGLCALLTAASFAQQPTRGRRGFLGDSRRPGERFRPQPPDPDQTLADEEPTTPGAEADEGNRHGVIVNLSKGVDVAQVVKFISDETGKPVLKDKEVKGKITVYSADKIPREQALQLVYDALELEGIAVIETPRVIKLVPAEKAKTMRIQILEAGESAASITNRSQIVQKVFKLTTTSPKQIQDALKDLVGKHGSIGVDERTKTLMITDTADNVERFEQLVNAFDRVEAGQIISKIFKLEYADAEDLATIVSTMAVAGEGGEMEVRRQQQDRDYYRSRYYRGRASAQGQVAGDLVVIPDPRTNWLIVVGPPDKVGRIEQLVNQIDVPGRADAQIHVIDIKHADAYDLADDIESVFQRKLSREKQEILEVLSSRRGNQIIVLATPETYSMIEEMVKELDTPEAVQRETRTYELKYMDAYDMSEQLTQLYEEDLGGGFPFFFGRSYGRGSSRQQARFVPSVRTNSLMVIAQPSEYEFIEKMIKELDVEIPAENLAPRVYHIRHADASEMVQVLTELFEGETARRPGTSQLFAWRPRGRTRTDEQQVGALYGKVRFVAYTNTNSVVVITNNPQNFSIIAGLIQDLDVLDPEATNMLVIQLQYADAAELADSLNNLLSEGAVSRGGAQQQQRQDGQADEEEQARLALQTIFPWQTTQRRTTQRRGEEVRPISTLIGQVRIVADVRSQKLIVAAPSIYFDAVKQLVEDLDKPEPQVQLETYIVRLQTEGERRLGWRWTPDPSTITPEELDNAVLGLMDMGFIDTFAGGSARDIAAPSMGFDRTVPDIFRGGSLVAYEDQTLKPGKGVLAADVNLALLLQLLIKNRNASVAAHPQVTVNNNEQGRVFVGEYLPFPTGSVTSTEGRSAQVTYEYREVGTILLITPMINKQGRVVLEVMVDNERRKMELVGGNPVTERQTYNTKLTVEDGQTVWLGGMTEERLDNVVRRVPIVGHIPVIGFFFRKTDKVTVKSDIYTFITPTVIETAEQASAQYRKARSRIDLYKKEYEELELNLPPNADEPTSSTPRPTAGTGAPAASETSG